MLEAFFEFIAYIVFDIIAYAIIRPILDRLFRFLSIPIVDDFFNGLAKILAIILVCLVVWAFYHFINMNIQ